MSELRSDLENVMETAGVDVSSLSPAQLHTAIQGIENGLEGPDLQIAIDHTGAEESYNGLLETLRGLSEDGELTPESLVNAVYDSGLYEVLGGSSEDTLVNIHEYVDESHYYDRLFEVVISSGIMVGDLAYTDKPIEESISSQNGSVITIDGNELERMCEMANDNISEPLSEVCDDIGEIDPQDVTAYTVHEDGPSGVEQSTYYVVDTDGGSSIVMQPQDDGWLGCQCIAKLDIIDMRDNIMPLGYTSTQDVTVRVVAPEEIERAMDRKADDIERHEIDTEHHVTISYASDYDMPDRHSSDFTKIDGNIILVGNEPNDMSDFIRDIDDNKDFINDCIDKGVFFASDFDMHEDIEEAYEDVIPDVLKEDNSFDNEDMADNDDADIKEVDDVLSESDNDEIEKEPNDADDSEEDDYFDDYDPVE